MKGSRGISLDRQLEFASRRVRLGNAIKQRRAEIGLSHADIADALGMLPRSWAEVECGRRWLQPQDVPEVMNMLRVEPGWFVVQMLTNGTAPARKEVA